MHAEPTTFRDTPCIRLHADGANALVALHGAHMLSWIPADGRERLFLSERAVFDGQAAIRGGVPVIFPQFAERGPLLKHGFARTTPWTFHGIDDDAALFELAEDGTRFPGWPHPFRARLRLHLDATRLSVTLEIANTGDEPFAFTAALHTYLRVADIANVTLEGLQGCDYEDSANGGTLHREHNYEVTFDGEVDRIYGDVVAPLAVIDGNGTLAIEQEGFGDVVVWNPGASLCARIADLAADDWRRFVCVEAAQVVQPVVLAPGERWAGMQRLG
ncbi:D-hexose-6-phosphate mutarotase [Thermomonas carbonis]|uniref:Putative glucose-6-phosphate 1-epimerase n=1 Tax=Thermomonas carbonis TaxID=1463158 RepID=A0A7G9STP7_9GAMM|nr:D-hexose-6-phosphate mutarotase [Thermomonas carbonis]QNN71222.1 D-hexose-6-phosphate mutarotase [Thermomonas carbonis]GHC11097.1 D-hexose-6-phosphate mutarotase [Thermomonas carbonis]